jgi:hypothetical protein
MAAQGRGAEQRPGDSLPSGEEKPSKRLASGSAASAACAAEPAELAEAAEAEARRASRAARAARSQYYGLLSLQEKARRSVDAATQTSSSNLVKCPRCTRHFAISELVAARMWGRVLVYILRATNRR